MDIDTTIDEKIMGLIAESVPSKFKKNTITPATHLRRELGMDSIGILSFVFRFEKAFGIDLSKTNFHVDMSEIRTAGDAVNLARKVIEQSQPANGA
ncbi:MAG TPA: phosphopantetheine-binding protein [Candidatus Angelobacter sp.]|nr:phosphopantetheine-binding protein [Candidatus Angelobacter sp.]